jgi:anti-anti-sigma regulatory factor
MAASCALRVGRTPGGYCVRVEGRGTFRESETAAAFAERVMDGEGAALAVDLTGCTHLDSTFLGCLLEIKGRFAAGDRTRFAVAAPPETVRRLFGPTRLDRVLNVVPSAPDVAGEWSTLHAAAEGCPSIGRHVMECHRRLAQVPGPSQAAFAAIADQLSHELAHGERADIQGR